MNPIQIVTRAADITRGAFARTNADLLVNDPDGFPSDYPPMWWIGLDSGGGAYPIGPNGPYAGMAPARSVVIRATALITGPLTSAPFRVVDLAAAGQPQPTPRWLTDPMLVRPDDRFGATYPAARQLTRAAFWVEWLRSAIWWGLGAFICTEDAAGQPQAGSLRVVDPFALSTERDPADGSLRWVLGGADAERVVFDRNGRVDLGLTDRAGNPVPYRIVVLRNPHSPVDQDGMSQGVFAMSPNVFTFTAQVDAYASGQFRSGVPNGYLKANSPAALTQEQVDSLKSKWMAAHGGDRRSIAILNATTEFVPINLSPVDAALAEVKRLNVADTAFAFALDPYTLGAGMGNSATYTNLRDAWEHHHDFGLAPWIAGVQDCLSALQPGQQSVLVNLDGFANPSEHEAVETGKLATEAGLYTINEWRASRGMVPLDEPQPEPQPLELVPPQPEGEVAADATA